MTFHNISESSALPFVSTTDEKRQESLGEVVRILPNLTESTLALARVVVDRFALAFLGWPSPKAWCSDVDLLANARLLIPPSYAPVIKVGKRVGARASPLVKLRCAFQ